MDQIKSEENLARYILHKNYISALHKRVKYAVFMPAPNGETSVFRISCLSENEIWEIGNREVSQKRGLPLLGRADISAFHILDENLQLIPDNNPPRHANIVGWPSEKSEQKLIAMELAENAQLHLK
ncbi:MAG TPA: hypothetical protein ACFYDZ_09105 [Candidatus Brocadiaceae bacterium]